MPRTSDPRGWLDTLMGWAFGLLLTAVALWWAVRLVMAVWVPLVVIVAVLVGLWGIAAIVNRLRRTRGPW